MEKLKTIIGILCLAGSYFTSHYASTTPLDGMMAWGFMMTTLLVMTGTILIIIDNTQ